VSVAAMALAHGLVLDANASDTGTRRLFWWKSINRSLNKLRRNA
jgi:hypothetical protein